MYRTHSSIMANSIQQDTRHFNVSLRQCNAQFTTHDRPEHVLYAATTANKIPSIYEAFEKNLYALLQTTSERHKPDSSVYSKASRMGPRTTTARRKVKPHELDLHRQTWRWREVAIIIQVSLKWLSLSVNEHHASDSNELRPGFICLKLKYHPI